MSPRTELHQFLTNHGQDHRTDEILKAYRDGTLAYWLHQHGLFRLTQTELPTLLMAAHADEQYAQCRRWAALLWKAGYPTELHGSGEAAPFHQEWRVFGPGWHGPQVATIVIDGCGASWKGDDALWLKVIGPSVGVTD